VLNVETPTFAAVLLALIVAVLGRGGPAQFVAALAALRDGTVTGRAVLVLWMARLRIPLRHREDATQDTLEAAWKAWDRFDPDHQRDRGRKGRPIFAAWMNAITVNIAGRWLDRAHLRREVLSPDPIPRRVADQRRLAHEILAADEERNELLAYLAELAKVDPRGAQVIIGHDLEELSMAELADAIGVPTSTAYKIRARGLAALRNMQALPADERDPEE
jgi:RNA polymerase sigma factor (sigma-70 family)